MTISSALCLAWMITDTTLWMQRVSDGADCRKKRRDRSEKTPEVSKVCDHFKVKRNKNSAQCLQ